MNWFSYLSLVLLSASVLGNSLAFQRAAHEWALLLSAPLTAFLAKNKPEQIFSPRMIQCNLVPPCVFLWFWIGLASTSASILAGLHYFGWQGVVAGIVAAASAGRVARGIWPQPSSQMYAAAFAECLHWRLAHCKAKEDKARAEWLATVIAAMEQTMGATRAALGDVKA